MNHAPKQTAPDTDSTPERHPMRTSRTTLRRVMARSRALLLAGGLLLALPVSASGASSHDPIVGSGSSWAANAINQWVADVYNNYHWRVDFTAVGAARGRQEFAIPKTDFGVSDIGYQGTDTAGNPDTSNGRAFAYLPIAAGGTALPYNIVAGGKRVDNLRLSGETIAKIFTGKITNWNDAAVTKDNNGKQLPSIPIIPVIHAEGAGVTNQFTSYLADQYPSIWAPCNGGKAEATEYYPLNCGHSSGNMKAFTGSNGVMNYLAGDGANGAIGIEEYSYPLLKGFPSAKVLNKSGYYTLPTQYNVAVALTAAVINDEAHGYSPSDQNYLLQKLDKVYVNPDKRTYPLSSYVYAIIPTSSGDAITKTTGRRQTVADFLSFSICQGQKEIGPIGYSPLPINLVKGGFTQISKLKKADSAVSLASADVTRCDNPTFIKNQPNKNHLAEIAPMPPSCDKLGPAPAAPTPATSTAIPMRFPRPTTGPVGTVGPPGPTTVVDPMGPRVPAAAPRPAPTATAGAAARSSTRAPARR